MLELIRAYRMRVELQTPEVRHPGERRRVARHHPFGDAAGREAKGDDLDPRRSRGGRALLVEGLAVDAVSIADEHVRPVTRSPQCALGYGKVVADDLQLGDPGFREVDLARVRDRDLAAGDLDRHPLGFARRHPPSIRPGGRSMHGGQNGTFVSTWGRLRHWQRTVQGTDPHLRAPNGMSLTRR